MDFIGNLFENIKEQLKTALATQQESALFIRIKEKYETLSPLGQKSINWASFIFGLFIIFWWPLSNLMDSSDFASRFDERRQILKDLLRIERDLAAAPIVRVAPPPSTFKMQFDQKLTAGGVKPEQLREQSELAPLGVSGTQQMGYHFRIAHVTIRQAIDIAYEMEHVDTSLKLLGFALKAEPLDPHFYETSFKIVNYTPKVVEAGGFGGGGGSSAIMDAIKKTNGGGPSAPAGSAPVPMGRPSGGG